MAVLWRGRGCKFTGNLHDGVHFLRSLRDDPGDPFQQFGFILVTQFPVWPFFPADIMIATRIPDLKKEQCITIAKRDERAHLSAHHQVPKRAAEPWICEPS